MLKRSRIIDKPCYSNPHIVISISFAVVILIVLLYSIIFKWLSHPIPAILTEQTGLIPPSKGLSSAFAEIVRGNFSQAISINAYSIRIFSFFAIQLPIRLLVVFLLYKMPNRSSTLAITDAFFSIALFAYCFYPLIVYTVQTIIGVLQQLTIL
jgi:hypothetical protein